MIPLLLEGFESALLPCSLIILIPAAAAAIAARDDLVPALSGFFGAAVLLSWLRFSDRGGDWPIGIAAMALIIAAVLFTVPFIANRSASAAVAGAFSGAAAAQLWEPCVGAEFGSLLNDLPTTGASGLGLMVVFLLGVTSPVIGLVALLKLMPEWILDYAQTALSIVGATVLAVMAVATAAGLHDDVVGQLIRWSV